MRSKKQSALWQKVFNLEKSTLPPLHTFVKSWSRDNGIYAVPNKQAEKTASTDTGSVVTVDPNHITIAMVILLCFPELPRTNPNKDHQQYRN